MTVGREEWVLRKSRPQRSSHAPRLNHQAGPRMRPRVKCHDSSEAFRDCPDSGSDSVSVTRTAPQSEVTVPRHRPGRSGLEPNWSIDTFRVRVIVQPGPGPTMSTRDANDSDIDSIQKIYAHHVVHGTGMWRLRSQIEFSCYAAYACSLRSSNLRLDVIYFRNLRRRATIQLRNAAPTARCSIQRPPVSSCTQRGGR